MLEHADRDKGVALPADVAVVLLDELDTTGQPCHPRAVSGVVGLLARDGERANRHAVVPRHVQRQGAPPAAGFDDPLIGAQPELAAHVVQLGPLGVLQRHLRRRVVGARVDHVAVEPEAVEIVAKIIVMVQARPGSVHRVRRPPLPQRSIAGGLLLHGPEHGFDRAGEVAIDGHPAGPEPVSKADVSVPEQAPQRASVGEADGRDRLGVQSIARRPVPQREPHRGVAQRGLHRAKDPAVVWGGGAPAGGT